MKYVISVAVVAVLTSGFGGTTAEAFVGGFGKGVAPNGSPQGVGINVGGAMTELIPREMRDEFRKYNQARMQEMSPEERGALRTERRESSRMLREQRHSGIESFVGLSREELQDVHASGETMGETLARQGVSEEDARQYLTNKAETKVEHIVARHELNDDQAQTLRERVGMFVDRMIAKWFAK